MNISIGNISINDVIDSRGKIRSQFNDQPAYQRKSVWSKEDKEELIYSIFLGRLVMPIQLHIVGERKDIVDGKQRLTAIGEFIENTIVIQKEIDLTHFRLGTISAGSKIVDLTLDQETHFKQTKLQTVEITYASPSEIRDFFLVQNAGRGLNPSEKRNAIDSIVRDQIADYISQHPLIKARKISEKRFGHHAFTAQLLRLVYDRYHDNTISIGQRGLENLYRTDAKDSFKFDVNFRPAIEKLEKTLDHVHEKFVKHIEPKIFKRISSGIVISIVDLVNDGLIIDSVIFNKLKDLASNFKGLSQTSPTVALIHSVAGNSVDSPSKIEKRKVYLMEYLTK